MNPQPSEHLDVLIIGAGISGIGAACHLRRQCPGHSFAILETREALGGTWDLFRYPGIRSDSDMYTLGYGFRPWQEREAIAEGDAILRYLEDTAREYELLDHIRYRHRVVAAAWDSGSNHWTVRIATGDTDAVTTLTCNFLLSCSGYYNYEEGFTPEFAGQEQFQGRLLHAQHWPEDLDYRDRRVVVIGSGATAVTLVPELAREAASTVMLQRSPTYIASVPARDTLAQWLHRYLTWLPPGMISRLTRWRRILFQIYIYQMSRRRPEAMKQFLLDQVREELGPDYDVDTHFTPNYNPWDQRLCAVPDGDLFAALRAGRAEVVTDHIESFTPQGIKLASGRELAADIVVLATGLNLQFLGDVDLSVDGEAVDTAGRYVFRGMMLSGVPNMVFTVGYTNSSWTLKADLTADYACRLLRRMQARGKSKVVAPTPDPSEVGTEPLLDFSAGYVLRARDQMPSQGRRKPWRVRQNYILDRLDLRLGSLAGGTLEFD